MDRKGEGSGLSAVGAGTRYRTSKHRLSQLLIDTADTLQALSMRNTWLDLSRVLEKLAQERFNVAVVGQFKRGKSSLLNAIIGSELLPTGMLPLTSTVTSVRYDSHPYLRISFEESSWDRTEPVERLADYVTERGNPGNHLKIHEVQVRVPEPYLRRGVVFVDTPGIGSSIEANTRTAYGFLPFVDAAIFVTGAESPFSAAERDLLRAVATRVSAIFLVVNKIDLVKRDMREDLVRYMTSEAERCGISSPRIFVLSALDALEARSQRDERRLHESGLPQLTSALDLFLSGDRGRAFLISVSTAADEIVRRALSVLTNHVDREALEIELGTLERELMVTLNRQDAEFTKDVASVYRPRWKSRLYSRVDALVQKRRSSQTTAGELMADLSSDLEEAQQIDLGLLVEKYTPRLVAAAGNWAQRRKAALEKALGAELASWLDSLQERLTMEAGNMRATYAVDSGTKLAGASIFDLLPRSLFNRSFAHAMKRRADAVITSRTTAFLQAIHESMSMEVERICSVVRSGLIPEDDRRLDPGDVGEKGTVLRRLVSLDDALRRFSRSLSENAPSAAEEELTEAGAGSARAGADPVQADPVDAARLGAAAAVEGAAVEAAPEREDDRRRPVPALRSQKPMSFQSSAYRAGCPVCSAVMSRMFDFFVEQQSILVHSAASRRALAKSGGFCQRHTWQFEFILSPVSASIAFPELLDAVSERLRTAAAEGAHAGNGADVEPAGRMRGDPWGAAQPSDDPMCGACRAGSEAEAAAIREILALLASEPERIAYRNAFGLCLPHLHQALPRCGDRDLERLLVESAADHLALDAEDMREFALRRAARRADLNNDEQENAWQSGLRRLAGERNVSMPWRERE